MLYHNVVGFELHPATSSWSRQSNTRTGHWVSRWSGHALLQEL